MPNQIMLDTDARRGWVVDDLILVTLYSDRDRLLRELDAYALDERSIHPSDADIAVLRTRLTILSRLIARQEGVNRSLSSSV